MFTTQALSQRDPQWKGVVLGFGDASTTIGSDGCTLTCLTMVANGFGFQETPASLNDRLKALGPGHGFLGPLMVWSGLPAALPGMRLNRFVLCRDQPAPMVEIDMAIEQGRPVVVELDQSPAAGLQNHWVLVLARQGDDYLILDPWPVPAEAGASLLQRYGHAGTAAQIITAAVFYSNPNATGRSPADTPVMVVVNDEPEIHAAGGLALREAPISGAIKRRLPAGTVLDLVEPAIAQGDVGVRGQWLNVRAPEDLAGFVAAWLVHAAAMPLTGDGKRVADITVVDETLMGLVQPPLRHAAVLVVIVNRPARSVPTARPAGKGRRTSTAIQPARPAGVPLRAKASRGRVIATLKPGTSLTVVEAAKGAGPKIGRRGQWLNVRDGKGQAGFVSAAAVHLKPGRK
ncbi:MAG: SH3 domain-containing protein [Chloroflexi bacterium]|nr:SH3 domain-containing protein [Chloroflexota bacterium]